MAEFRETRKRPRRRLLQEALETVTTDNVELHKIVIVLENEQRESERIERQLVQEVESLREHIVKLKGDSQKEEKRLNETISVLKAELYDLGLSARDSGSGNKNTSRSGPEQTSFWSRMTNLTLPLSCCRSPAVSCIREEKQREREVDFLSSSDSGAVLYDRKNYSWTKGGPIFQKGPGFPVTRGGPDDIYHTRDFSRQSQPRRTPGDFELNPRTSSPVPRSPQDNYITDQEYPTRGARKKHERILTTHEEVEAVEAAARAFLFVFSNIKLKLLRTLWHTVLSSVLGVETRTSEDVLDIEHLPLLLHRLVVFAYQQDNPHQYPPSPQRTKPLISLLKLRLTPYVEGRQYLTFEQFKNFPQWLQPRAELKMPIKPSNLSSQNQGHIRQDDARRHLQIGSACYIWSEGGRVWCEGEVIASKYDKEGEWLVVRYFNNSRWSEKEVQRYSDLVWGITPG